MIAIGSEDRWHLQLAQRWIVQYNFYINDQRWGRMFVRTSPYLPFSARVCLNQHHWVANRMRAEGIDFEQCSNAFLRCSHPQKLQAVIEDLDLPNPVIRSHYRKGFLKQYVRDHLCLRTELATNDVTDYGIRKAVENLLPLRDKLATICDNYLTV